MNLVEPRKPRYSTDHRRIVKKNSKKKVNPKLFFKISKTIKTNKLNSHKIQHINLPFFVYFSDTSDKKSRNIKKK